MSLYDDLSLLLDLARPLFPWIGAAVLAVRLAIENEGK